MTLHIISCSPNGAGFQPGLEVAGVNDAILLVGNAVYATTNRTLWMPLEQLPCPVYALKEDAEIRGVSTELTAQNLAWVEYDQWVELAVSHDQSVSWYE